MACTVPSSRLEAALATAFIRGFVGLLPGRTCQMSSLKQSVQTNLPAPLWELYQNHSGEEKACLALQCFFKLCCLICASALMMLQWSLSEWFCWNVMLHLSQGISQSRTHSDKAVSPKASEVSDQKRWVSACLGVSAVERDIKCNFIYWKAFEDGFK